LKLSKQVLANHKAKFTLEFGLYLLYNISLSEIIMQINPTNVLIALSLERWQSALDYITSELAIAAQKGYFVSVVTVSEYVKCPNSNSLTIGRLMDLEEACKHVGLPIKRAIITSLHNSAAKICFEWRHNG
jgi:hypothetical protein